MTRTANVQDRQAENGIKLINVIASLTLLMIGGFGAWIGSNIEKMKNDMQVFSGIVQTLESRVSRNEKDIQKVDGKTDSIQTQIYTLQGDIKAWKK